MKSLLCLLERLTGSGPQSGYGHRSEVMRIALVACCGQKLDRAAPDSELYISPLFKKAAAYARTFKGWYIISAKYGLVRPDAVVEPYDCTLLKMRKTDRLAWGRKVLEQMIGEGIARAEFVALAGAKYTEPLVRAGLSVETPIKGLGIGKQLAWLTRKAPGVTKGVGQPEDSPSPGLATRASAD